MVKQKKPLKMRDFLARVGSLRILYRYPCPHSTKLYFVCQTICRLSTPFVNLVLAVDCPGC